MHRIFSYNPWLSGLIERSVSFRADETPVAESGYIIAQCKLQPSEALQALRELGAMHRADAPLAVKGFVEYTSGMLLMCYCVAADTDGVASGRVGFPPELRETLDKFPELIASMERISLTEDEN